MKKQHVVIFSGAGMSAESGIKTFRDNDGLWENYNISEVATPQAWRKDKALVLEFYNLRRKQLFQSSPNPAHYAVAELEKTHKVTVITQNIDDLHERAGSSNVVHLHGELKKVKSEKFKDLIYSWEKEELVLGDLCEKGHQLRPHVVWFGEDVPMMDDAFKIASMADVFIVIGTSLNVYPAAGIINYIPNNCSKYLIDPNPPSEELEDDFIVIKEKAAKGMEILSQRL